MSTRSWRTRVTDAVTAEAGARWDSYSYPDDLEFDVVSPRLNLVYAFGDDNELRAAWGVVHQPQAVNELQVEDDVEQFFEPERSEQFVVGYTRHFARGLSLRVDVYDKDYSDLRAALRESARSRSSSFPKAPPTGSASMRPRRARAASNSRCGARPSAACPAG